MTDLFTSKVTIYNDIPATAVTPRRFERHVIDKCNVQSGYVSRADGTIENIVNATTIITRDVARFLPFSQYVNTPIDVRAEYFTAHIGDFVVFGEIDDVVETAQEWQQLQKKYEGAKITSVSPNIYGMGIDNITMANA